MKSLVIFALTVLCLSGEASVGGDTHGGAGVRRNGQYLTVGSANVLVSPVQADLPELNFVIDKIMELKLDENIAARLLESVSQTVNRKYFMVEKVSEEKEKEFVRAYKNLFQDMRQDDSVVLYGITDTTAKETYLLPSYNRLPDMVSKATILFHESLWLFSGVHQVTLRTPDNKYAYDEWQTRLTKNEVVDLEVAFERFARCSSNCSHVTEKLINLLLKASVGSRELGYANDLQAQNDLWFTNLSRLAQFDFMNKSLPLINPNGSISLAELLGPDLSADLQNLIPNYQGNATAELSLSVPKFKIQLVKLLREYPQSSFLQGMQIFAGSMELNLTFDTENLKKCKKEIKNVFETAQIPILSSPLARNLLDLQIHNSYMWRQEQFRRGYLLTTRENKPSFKSGWGGCDVRVFIGAYNSQR
jgi:hypothetical protein